MKKTIFLSLVVTTAVLSGGCSKNCTVKGYVDGLNGYVYVLTETNPDTITDTILVENGRFTYTVNDMRPAIYVFEGGVGENYDNMEYFHTKVFIEPGTVRIQTDTTAWSREYVTNHISDSRAATIAKGTPTNNAYLSFSKKYAAFLNSNPKFDIFDDETRAEVDEFVNKYYLANRKNYFGAYLLEKMKYYYSGHELLAELDAFPATLQATYIVTTLRELGERMTKTDVGEHYIDVVQNDPDGNPISLSSVVENSANKYVLLNFWASWGTGCLGEAPYLAKTYDEFHEKGFEIYGVSFDAGLKRWTMFIESENIPGIHVSDLNRFDNEAAEDYAVYAVPMNFLIETATGTIIARNLRHDYVYDTISELLGE